MNLGSYHQCLLTSQKNRKSKIMCLWMELQNTSYKTILPKTVIRMFQSIEILLHDAQLSEICFKIIQLEEGRWKDTNEETSP